MLNTTRIETAKRLLHECIAEANNGFLSVNAEAQNVIDFALAQRNAGYNDGYLLGLKTALNIIEGVFDIEPTEAKTA